MSKIRVIDRTFLAAVLAAVAVHGLVLQLPNSPMRNGGKQQVSPPLHLSVRYVAASVEAPTSDSLITQQSTITPEALFRADAKMALKKESFRKADHSLGREQKAPVVQEVSRVDAGSKEPKQNCLSGEEMAQGVSGSEGSIPAKRSVACEQG